MNSTENKETTIPIVLASDNKYSPFMYITILSVLQTTNKNTFYDFYLLIPSIFSKNNKEKNY